MNPLEKNDFPRCTIDFALEFSQEEIVTLAPCINTLLKSNYLIGTSLDFDGAFQSIFDIAMEIAEVDCCAYISGSSEAKHFEIAASRNAPHVARSESSLFLPVSVARSFNKGIQLSADKDPRFAKICEVWNSNSLIVFPLRREMDFIGALLFGKRNSHAFSPVKIKLLWFLAGQAENLILQRDSVRTLSFYSFLDPLTHLYNRRYFDELLEKEIFRSRRTGKSLSLLMLDLDGFKAYNDTFLHSAGDIALQEIAAILRDCVREVDTVARLGGDEFAILLVESTSHGARDLAGRIVERMKRHLLPGRGNVRTERLSASIGVAAFPSDAFDKLDLVHKSDHALYMAKGLGGGQVCLYTEVSDLVSLRENGTEIPVQKIYDAARSVVDMDLFLEILLFTAMQGISARRGSIVVINPDGNFTFRAAVGFGNGEVRFSTGMTIPPGAVTSWVAENKEPLLVTGQKDMPLPVPLRRNGYQSTSFLSIPLLHEGKVLGVLHLTKKAGDRPFTRDDLESFSAFSREITTILAQGISFLENVKMFSMSILRSLSRALEVRYPFLTGHSTRVRDLSLRIGRRLRLGTEELATLENAAVLHDIGIVGIPGEIISKGRKLTDRELEIARKHPFLGAKLLEGVPGMEKTRQVILEHQEFFNGSGYPRGLRGEEISLEARILSVVEYYDSITSPRPHRGELRREEALQLMGNSRNTLFDDGICQAFLEEMESALLGEGPVKTD